MAALLKGMEKRFWCVAMGCNVMEVVEEVDDNRGKANGRNLVNIGMLDLLRQERLLTCQPLRNKRQPT